MACGWATWEQVCTAAAEQAYEEGGVRGLCAEGRWGLEIDAMRALDLQALLAV